MKLKFVNGRVSKKNQRRRVKSVYPPSNEWGNTRSAIEISPNYVWVYGEVTSYENGRWMTWDQFEELNKTGIYHCTYHVYRQVWSAKAFLRLVRKWGRYLPAGVEFMWCSNYFRECDVIART